MTPARRAAQLFLGPDLVSETAPRNTRIGQRDWQLVSQGDVHLDRFARPQTWLEALGSLVAHLQRYRVIVLSETMAPHNQRVVARGGLVAVSRAMELLVESLCHAGFKILLTDRLYTMTNAGDAELRMRNLIESQTPLIASFRGQVVPMRYRRDDGVDERLSHRVEWVLRQSPETLLAYQRRVERERIAAATAIESSIADDDDREDERGVCNSDTLAARLASVLSPSSVAPPTTTAAATIKSLKRSADGEPIEPVAAAIAAATAPPPVSANAMVTNSRVIIYLRGARATQDSCILHALRRAFGGDLSVASAVIEYDCDEESRTVAKHLSPEDKQKPRVLAFERGSMPSEPTYVLLHFAGAPLCKR